MHARLWKNRGFALPPRRRFDQRQRDGHRCLNPEPTTSDCDVSAHKLGYECAGSVFRQTFFASNGTFEHTFGQTRAIPNCVTGERR